MRRISRRTALSGLLLGMGGAALRPAGAFAQGAVVGPAPAEDLVRASGLSGLVSYAVIDVRSGQLVEAMAPGRPMSPASTAKTITTLYALDTLGAGYRFATRLLATGPLAGGRIGGDLILVGGGDPTLSTDDLGDMAVALSAKGVRGVAGRFLVWDGAIPYAETISDDQPLYASYSPAVSGLNLNFNRVHASWKRKGGGYTIGMDAPGGRFAPRVSTAEVVPVARRAPLFAYSRSGGKERWTVAAEALGTEGGRWLPVRDPAGYAGDVFRTLAGGTGVALPAPQRLGGRASGTELVRHMSDPLPPILREMLRYSTNVTAESVGRTASVTRGKAAGGSGSGAAMTEWLETQIGRTGAHFVDHSGLGSEDRIAPVDMARAVALLGPRAGLRGLLKPFVLRDNLGRFAEGQKLRIDAKTGTLNFVSTLTGYLTAPGGRDLVFAVFTADPDRVAQSRGTERPPGGLEWIRRSKILQSRLLERWGALYG